MPQLNPLFVTCALRELALTGYPDAQYDHQLAAILPYPKTPFVIMNDEVVKSFATSTIYTPCKLDTLESLRARCHQMVSAYDIGETVTIGKNRTDKLLMRFQDTALTAQKVEDGLSFHVWDYDENEEWFKYKNPYDTRDYPGAKLQFCFRSGLLAPEQFDIRLSEAEMDALNFDLGFHGIAQTQPGESNHAKSYELTIEAINGALTRRIQTLSPCDGGFQVEQTDGEMEDPEETEQSVYGMAMEMGG